jgi:hypothetical protein
VAAERGADQNNKDIRRAPSIKGISSGQQEDRHSFVVTDGRATIGAIEQRGRQFDAIALPSRALGAFASMKAAADAISAAYGGGQ